MKKYFLNYCFCYLSLGVMAQSPALLDEKANAPIPNSVEVQIKQKDLPAQFSLKAYCPTPNNSQGIASTVFQSICYGAMTMIYAAQYQLTTQAEIDKIAFSAMYPYRQLTKDCHQGLTFYESFNFLKRKGTPFWADFEQNRANAANCNSIITEMHHRLAQDHKLKDFIRLFQDSDRVSVKKYHIQKSLVAKQPVIVGIQLPENFSHFKPAPNETLYYKPQGERIWSTSTVIVGYDEHSVELLNHFGTEWGQNGFFKMEYDDFFKHCKDAYQIVFDANPDLNLGMPMSGQFEWLTPIFGAMHPVPFELKQGKYYQTIRKMDAGQQFQLSIKALQKGKYLYVFSQDLLGDMDWHFPKNYITDEVEPKRIESPLIVYDNSDYLLPNSEHVLAKSREGTDTFFILYSNNPLDINDLKKRLKAMDKNTQRITPLEKFESAFQGLLTDWNNIQYDPSQLAFQTPATNQIVPLIFKVF